MVHDQQLEHILTHSAAVAGARLSQDETRLLSWCEDGRVTLWDLSTGRRLLLMKHERWVDDARFGKDEKTILTQGRDGAVRLWHAESGKLLVDLPHQGEVQGAVLCQDQTQVLTWATGETAVLLWNLDTGDVAQRFPHDIQPLGAAFSQDEERVLTWGYDGTVRLWDMASAKPLQVLKRAYPCSQASFCRDEDQILVACGKAVLLWSPALDSTISVADFNSRLTHDYLENPENRANYDSRVNGVVLDSQERKVLSWSRNGTVQLWDAATGRALAQMKGNQWDHLPVFNKAGSRMLTSHRDGAARVLDTRFGDLLAEFVRPHPARGAAFDDEGRILVWYGDGTVRLWDLRTDAILNTHASVLGVEVRTGTRLDEFGELKVLTEEVWQGKKREYLALSSPHSSP